MQNEIVYSYSGHWVCMTTIKMWLEEASVSGQSSSPTISYLCRLLWWEPKSENLNIIEWFPLQVLLSELQMSAELQNKLAMHVIKSTSMSKVRNKTQSPRLTKAFEVETSRAYTHPCCTFCSFALLLFTCWHNNEHLQHLFMLAGIHRLQMHKACLAKRLTATTVISSATEYIWLVNTSIMARMILN